MLLFAFAIEIVTASYKNYIITNAVFKIQEIISIQSGIQGTKPANFFSISSNYYVTSSELKTYIDTTFSDLKLENVNIILTNSSNAYSLTNGNTNTDMNINDKFKISITYDMPLSFISDLFPSDFKFKREKIVYGVCQYKHDY